MQTIIIGSGNVATHLAKALKTSGHEIVQVYSRTFDNAAKLARIVGAEPTDNPREIYPSADLYLFSVKDDALPGLIARMPPTGGVWVHTAGSIPIDALLPHSSRGVIYPLQTFSREREVNFRDVPLFIEGDSAQTIALLRELAESISENVHLLLGEKRRFLHLAAVFACNFANHMYTLASEIIGEENIPFHLLNPLITETASKVAMMQPRVAQTGPAVRFDKSVMQKHLELLHDPLKREIYTLLSKSIHRVSVGE